MLNLENGPQNINEVAPLKTRSIHQDLLVFTSLDIRKIDFKTGKLRNIDFQFNAGVSELTSLMMTGKG